MFVTKHPSQPYYGCMLIRLMQKIGKGLRRGTNRNVVGVTGNDPTNPNRTISEVTDKVIERMLDLKGIS